MHGNSFPRNPLMANFCAKTMPYRGLGSGIPRVLKEDSDVQFVDNKEGNQFTAIIKRPALSEVDITTTDVVKDVVEHGAVKLTDRQRIIISLIKQFVVEHVVDGVVEDGVEKLSARVISKMVKRSTRTIQRELSYLQEIGLIKYVGTDTKGYYEVLDNL